MSALLILSSLDVGGRRNNREHHVIRAMRESYDEIWVVYRRRGRRAHAIRDALIPSVARQDVGAIHYIAVSPVLNLPEGAVRERLGESSGRAAALAPIADAVAIGKDLATVLALAWAAIRHVPRGADCQAMGPWAAGAARILRGLSRIPAYVYVDRDYEPGFVRSAIRRRWTASMERAGLRRADLRLSIGGRLRALRQAETGLDVHLSPTGVEGGRFRARIRSEPRPEMIFIGRVEPWSGIEESIGALALLAPRHPDARLRVFGEVSPGYRARLEAQAAAEGVASRFRFEGNVGQDRLAAELDKAAIGLAVFRPVPLRIYAAPLKVIEYMASGLPVVALAGSEAGDLVEAAGAGVSTTVDARAIAAAIEGLIADPERYRAMSRAGIEESRRLDWTDILEREHALMAAAAPRGQALA